MNILIAVPSMDTVPAVFAQALSMLHKVGNCAIAFQVGSLIYTSRNALATRAIEMGADYVLWLDSDMFFEPDTLERMLKRMQEKDIDFLTGVYYRRGEPYTPVLNDVLKMNSDEIPIWHDMTELPEEELFELIYKYKLKHIRLCQTFAQLIMYSKAKRENSMHCTTQ